MAEGNFAEATLEPVDGRWRLRFRRALPHPPDAVWRAFTDEELLAAWFPTTLEGELRPGAELRFRYRGVDMPPVTGEMLAARAPRLLEFTWGFSGDPAERPEQTRFEIAPAGGGSTLLLETTYDALGKSARDAAGWHLCLEQLERRLAGAPPLRDAAGRWKELNRRYIERFGPDAATIGPPESMSEYR